MAIGRISGPLLKANLLRDGVNLAFETDLLFLDVVNGRIGIKTANPTHDLTVNGTTRTTNLEVTTEADIASFNIVTNTISSSEGTIRIEPSGSNPVVYQGKLVTGNLQLSENTIETLGTNTDLNIETTGTGNVNINTSVEVYGDIHATGNISADGDITIGDQDTDSITFNADIASNLIPDVTNTYDLGSDPTVDYGGEFGKEWRRAYINDIFATTINASNISGSDIDLLLEPGNTYYVGTTGADSNTGAHPNDPFLTIKYALTQATAGDTVYIYSGTYQEQFPLTVPVGITVKGSGIRSVKIVPTTATNNKDAFLLNGETTIEDLTVADFFFDDVNNTGYAFKFVNNFTVTSRSPYIRNVSVIARGSVTSSADPYGFDSNDAGKGAYVDGSVANANSKEASMLFHSVTFFTPNQECIVATNGVRIEWLNCFTYFADKGIYAFSSASGFAGNGLTRLRINNQIGTWAVGNTVTYYDTDGTTVLASGTVASIDGNYVNLTGRQLGFETITSRAGKIVYAQGDAKLSTAEKKFGTASLALDGTGDYASIPSTPDFAYGTNEFTIEMWIYRTVSGATQVLLDQRTANPTNFAPVVFINTSNALQYNDGASSVIIGTTTVPLNTWSHVALSRSGTSTRLFLNGVQQGSTYTDTRNYIQTPVTIGARFNNTQNFVGFIDDLRISKGIARYTANFTAPTEPFTGDLNTVLLLHFNGVDESTTFLDDGITFQDIRTSAGGTASLINFADYSDFGAEIRSIGSAAVYGNYGVYGDGAGVIAYLISQNFAYIGSGKLSTNDPTDRISANEVVELNDAEIYYTSVDNEGNFRVGDSFFVNQKTGDVLFSGQSLDISTLSGITFTDGTNTTTVTADGIDTGNLRISGNTIESLTGDVNITAANDTINLLNNTFITGNLDVVGNVTIGGNITIGDETTDTINFVAGIGSDLIPSTTETYDLGTEDLRWNNAYLSRAEIDGVVIDNNTISTSIEDDDLTLSASGTGKVLVPTSDVQINQNLTVVQDLTVTTGITNLQDVEVTGTITQTGNFNQTGDFATSGTVEVTGNTTLGSSITIPNITISGSSISTNANNLNLVLTAQGTGKVIVQDLGINGATITGQTSGADITISPAGGGVIINSVKSLVIPAGATADRPTVGVSGMIRYNTSLDRYEGFANGNWIALGGIQNLTGTTRITPELTPGAGDNTIRFYANDILVSTINSTKLSTISLETDDLNISNNAISAVATDTDINFTTSGTGGVVVGDLKFRNSEINNTVSGGITQFNTTGTGYVKVAGTFGTVIPRGTVANRPLEANTEIGMMRYNIDLQFVEIWNGTIWENVAASSGGINLVDATSLSIVNAIVFG